MIVNPDGVVRDRQIVRREHDGRRTVLASQYEGRRLNGPNDRVIQSDGAVHFTEARMGRRCMPRAAPRCIGCVC